jgi:hypothetical protein
VGRDLTVANGRKALSRARRLQRAKRWLASYRGTDPVRGYRKWFGVDKVCAIVELRMLGVDIPDARLEQARRDEQARAAHRARRPGATAAAGEWDAEFAFIAGYTEGGAPYGIAWDDLAADEVREWHRLAEAEGILHRTFDDDDDLPF